MGIRTPDLFHAMEARYQLRHSPALTGVSNTITLPSGRLRANLGRARLRPTQQRHACTSGGRLRAG